MKQQLTVMLSILSSLPQAALADRLDDFAGKGQFVHHVSLRGDVSLDHGRHQQLVAEHQGCVQAHTGLGHLVQALPPDGIPEVTLRQDVDLYYGEDRSLAEVHGYLYSIDRRNCALVRKEHRVLHIHYGQAGDCRIDLVKNTRQGMCSTDGRRLEPAYERSKLPAHLQAQVEQQLKQMQQQDEVRKKEALPPTKGSGSIKVVAGTRCEVFPVLGGEACIARPTESRFAIPTSHFNRNVPGLLLELKETSYDHRATTVTLNKEVGKDFFTAPLAGTAVKAVP